MAAGPFPFDRWGGLVKRYQGFPHGTKRLIDPISGAPVAFADDLIYENWILHRFNPSVVALHSSPLPIEVEAGEVTISAVAQLDLRRKCGRRELHLVCKTTPSRPKRRALQAVADALNANLIVRPRELIRRDPVLVSNLRHLRQVMTKWAGHGHEIDAEIARLLTTVGSADRLTVVQALAHFEPDLIDSRLGHMHCAGRVLLQLSGSMYGNRTDVASAQ